LDRKVIAQGTLVRYVNKGPSTRLSSIFTDQHTVALAPTQFKDEITKQVHTAYL